MSLCLFHAYYPNVCFSNANNYHQTAAVKDMCEVSRQNFDRFLKFHLEKKTHTHRGGHRIGLWERYGASRHRSCCGGVEWVLFYITQEIQARIQGGGGGGGVVTPPPPALDHQFFFQQTF